MHCVNSRLSHLIENIFNEDCSKRFQENYRIYVNIFLHLTCLETTEGRKKSRGTVKLFDRI